MKYISVIKISLFCLWHAIEILRKKSDTDTIQTLAWWTHVSLPLSCVSSKAGPLLLIYHLILKLILTLILILSLSYSPQQHTHCVSFCSLLQPTIPSGLPEARTTPPSNPLKGGTLGQIPRARALPRAPPWLPLPTRLVFCSSHLCTRARLPVVEALCSTLVICGYVLEEVVLSFCLSGVSTAEGRDQQYCSHYHWYCLTNVHFYNQFKVLKTLKRFSDCAFFSLFILLRFCSPA